MVISYELSDISKTIIGFLHVVFYALIALGIILTEAIFSVTNYSLFNQEFNGFEAQSIMGIVAAVGIISGIMILKSIKGGSYLSFSIGIFLIIGIGTNFLP